MGSKLNILEAFDQLAARGYTLGHAVTSPATGFKAFYQVAGPNGSALVSAADIKAFLAGKLSQLL